jgi:hypothetical protein
MGRTLFGIDLDESPAGGLVERLLDEEDLEKLDARPDGGTDAADGADAADGTDADDSGDPTETGDGTPTDQSPAWLNDAVSPGDDRSGDDASGDGSRVPGLGPGDGGDDGDGWRGRLAALRSRLRPLLLGAIGLAVLAAVLALLARRYGDRVVATLPGRIRPGEGGEASRPDDDDGPRSSEDGARAPDSPESETESDDDSGVAVAPDGDGGALVALAFLALVAALVRRATEDRPDPLADQ